MNSKKKDRLSCGYGEVSFLPRDFLWRAKKISKKFFQNSFIFASFYVHCQYYGQVSVTFIQDHNFCQRESLILLRHRVSIVPRFYTTAIALIHRLIWPTGNCWYDVKISKWPRPGVLL